MAKTTKKATKSPSKKAVAKKEVTFLENANIVHALAYFPYLIGAISMYFLGKTNKKAAMHHIKYSAMLALVALVLIVLLRGFFAQIVSLAYLVLSGFFAWKAYNGEEVKVEILDTIEGKISEIKIKK